MKRNTIVIIDRFEEDWAVLEYKYIFNVLEHFFPMMPRKGCNKYNP